VLPPSRELTGPGIDGRFNTKAEALNYNATRVLSLCAGAFDYALLMPLERDIGIECHRDPPLEIQVLLVCWGKFRKSVSGNGL
jgi:hypothetical protein